MKLNCTLVFLLFSGLACEAQDLLQGAIDSAYFFHARLSTQGAKLTGQYCYDNHDEWIDLDGSIDPAGNFTLYEYVNEKGKRVQHSVFKGSKNGTDLTGTWMMLDGKNRKRPFYFKKEISPGTKTTSCNSKTFFSNKNLPTRKEKVYKLIPDDVGGAGAVVWFDQSYKNKFTIEFEYQTWDDDGEEDWASTNSADGLSLILFQDKKSYETSVTPGGGDMGFIKNGSGLAVQFILYAGRRIRAIDGNGRVLAETEAQTLSQFTSAPSNPWSTVSVSVDGSRLTVVLDDGDPMTATIAPGTKDFSGFGIGAGTGGADALHQIKNVRITK